MDAITSSPLFGLTLTILIFIIGVRINENIRKPWTNPLLFATLVIILILVVNSLFSGEIVLY